VLLIGDIGQKNYTLLIDLQTGELNMHVINQLGVQNKPQSGFTLIELMVTVAIVGILAAIAYPSYSQYVVKSNRAAAEGFITSVANKQQQYLLDARSYATSMSALGYTSSNTPTEVSKNYDVSISANNAAKPPTFTITAAPKGAQLSRDTSCGSVSIDQAGTKAISGTGSVTSCW